jgi:hypothetical protein
MVAINRSFTITGKLPRFNMQYGAVAQVPVWALDSPRASRFIVHDVNPCVLAMFKDVPRPWEEFDFDTRNGSYLLECCYDIYILHCGVPCWKQAQQLKDFEMLCTSPDISPTRLEQSVATSTGVGSSKTAATEATPTARSGKGTSIEDENYDAPQNDDMYQVVPGMLVHGCDHPRTQPVPVSSIQPEDDPR